MKSIDDVPLPTPAAGQMLRPGAPGFKVYSEDQLRDYAARWGLACAEMERERCAKIAAPETVPYSDDEWRVRCEVRDAILDA